MTDVAVQSAFSLPAPALRLFVSHYAGVCAEGLAPGTHAGQPSRHAHLIVSFAEPIVLLRAPGGGQQQGHFTALVAGLHDAPAIVRQESRVHLVHVFFTALGVRAILGVSNAELTSRVVELSDLWGRRGTHLVEQLSGSASWSARFAHLDEAFSRALRTPAWSPRVTWAWEQLASSSGRLSISALARDVGWSRPHFTSRFRAEFGLGPKTAARIFRFEHACRALKADPRRIAQVAYSCGYHDQAHMTREWHALAGCSPRQWILQEMPFLQDYELSLGDDRDHDADTADLSLVQR